jgi:hypothetical protein
MVRCSAITKAGGACKSTPLPGSSFCFAHDPDHAEERKRFGSKGGRRGGRGRPSTELARLQATFEELADKVLSGEVERGVGAVAGQLLNGARACVRDSLAAKEQEELIARMEALEEQLAQQEERRLQHGA